MIEHYGIGFQMQLERSGIHFDTSSLFYNVLFVSIFNSKDPFWNFQFPICNVIKLQ